MALILTVDDDGNIRFYIRQTLEGAGHRVIEATEGGEALAHCQKQPAPDLILLDLVMPGMAGPATLAEMIHQGIRTPVIIVSAYLHDIGHELGPPVVGGLPKPFGREQLLNTVAEILEKQREGA